MRDATHTTIEPGTIPLPGLLDIAAEALLAEFREELTNRGYADLRPTHGCVFRFVREDGMRLTDLATNAGITKQSAGELVDDLVKLGYVERTADPDDRRAKLICLTERGREAQRVGFGIFTELEQRWAAHFGQERFDQLRELLEQIAAEKAPAAVPELSHAALAGVRGE
ncbi:MAG TPA: MarR family winged helix-turn-helix transcriptional regulator [Solirubrobacterales bacterium]|jgi:DNA-binding MarR family transcriptional regulator|nr:MarR family winged helix-turn-helix transcriptional regulator [Solirubrobacterales bacterium]